MAILAQFLLRLAFGLAVGMGITPPRLVSSGFYRNHLYVTLGLTTLAALVTSQLSTAAQMLAVAAAVFSFVGAACWLYEAKRAGVLMIWLVAALSLTSAEFAAGTTVESLQGLMRAAAILTSGLVLGLVFASMLLGHWYLNSPGMELAPLRTLLIAAAIAIGLHAAICAAGQMGASSERSVVTVSWMLFLFLRWSFGIVGVLLLLKMTWETLKIPNTQSATGILYVAVIGVFVGELAGLLLSAESAFPL